jgi:hypothetical protein
MELAAGSGAVVTTTTNASGIYTFTGLSAGRYTVTVVTSADLLVDSVFSASGSSLSQRQSVSVVSAASASVRSAIPTQIVVNLAANQNYGVADFGAVGANGIGDFVWNDLNKDGIQQAGEPGIANVQMELYNSAGALISTTVTTGGGFYSFDNLPAGIFRIEVAFSEFFFSGELNGWSASPRDVTTDTIDSDGDGLTHSVTVTLGSQAISTVDFGFYADGKSTIGNYVWRDANRDGDHQGAESEFLAGIDGVLVRLYLDDGDFVFEPGPNGNDGQDRLYAARITGNDPATGSTETGWYDFNVVADGNDFWVYVAPSNFAPGGPLRNLIFTNGNGVIYDPNNPQLVTSQPFDVIDYNLADFGYAEQLGSIGDYVWEDADGDTIQDPSEPGIPNVVVRLTDGLGNIITATTNISGNYSFPNLPAGTYTVTVNTASLPVDFNLATTPQVIVVNLDPGEQYVNADFGFKRLGIVVGDYVWYDVDKDGVQDIGEPGLGNITMKLWFDNDNDGEFNPVFDFQVDSTVTDAQGGYRLDAPAPGVYFVDVTDDYGLLALYAHTLGPQSIPDPSPPITLTQGQIYRDADFGYVRVPGPGNAIIGDLVWLDGDQDQLRDPSEPIIKGVLVCATPLAGGAQICETTDLNGRYLLEVPAGSYSVAPIAPPFGLTPSTPVPHLVSVAAGDQYLAADFGYYGGSGVLSALGGTIWQDLPVNDIVNGILDPGEPGIPSVSVDVIDDSNGNGDFDFGEPILATLGEYPDGVFLFDSLLPGDYLVRVSDTLQRLRYFAPTILGPNQGQDNNNQAQPYAIDLSPGETDTTADFGYREFDGTGGGDGEPDIGLIGDQVWYEADKNGLYSPGNGDIPVAGVTVQLLLNGAPVASTTTGAYGKYLFTDLELQDYTVRVTDAFGVLTGYPVTTLGPVQGDDDNNQLQPYAVTLGLQQDNLTADFGYTRSPAVAISKVLNTVPPVRSGESVSFTIRITNTGDTTIQVLPLRDLYDTGHLFFVEATPAANSSINDGQIDWSDLTMALGDLPPGATGTVVVSFIAGPDTSQLPNSETINRAIVTAASADPDGGGPLPPLILPPVAAEDGVVINNPTGVLLTDLEAYWESGLVFIRWTSLTEAQVVGFNVWRLPVGGDAEKLNPAPIVALYSGSNRGNRYDFVDLQPSRDAVRGYRVDALLVTGATFSVDVMVSPSAPYRVFMPVISRR